MPDSRGRDRKRDVQHPCSECGKSISGARITCGDACRSRRSHRIRAQKAAELGSISKEDLKLTTREVMKEELRPVVREAITADVLRGIASMVGLTPRAVELLQADLESQDANIRQRAYTLLLKYTMGNPAVAPTPEHQPPAFSVEFVMPRPPAEDNPPPEAEVITEAQTVISETEGATRLCQACGEDKLLSEFFGDAPRCTACHEKIIAQRDALLSDT